LDAVEPFDEWEGLALWGAHSVLLLAATKDAHTTSRTWFKELIPSIAMDETPQSARVKVQIGTTPLPRLHRRTQGAMYQPQADVLVHYGGTTFDSRQGSGDIYCSSECKPAKVSLPPNSLNYATITSTGSNSFLLVGGRTSPSRASSACFLYEDGDWTPVAELVPGRYRHSAAQVSVNGRDGVLVFGGKTSDGTVLNTWSLFINNEWHDLFIAGDVPPPLFGAALIATTLMQGLLAGGLNQNGRLQSNSSTVGFWHWIIDENSDRLFRVRTTSVPCFHPNESSSSSVARFGATAVNTVSGVLLIGGIGPQGPLRPEEETILLKLDGTVVPHEPVLHGTEALPMFIGHNVMKTADDDIIVAGGGMVCFSHGVFWNDSIHHLTFGNTNAKTGGTWNLVTDGSKSSDVVPHAPDRKAYKQILAQGLAATSNEPTKPLAGAPLQRLSTLAAIGKHISRSTSRPFVLEGLNLGPCTEQWSSDGLKARVGRDKATIIHAAASPHLSFHAKNFKYTTVDFASFINAAIAGEHVYMRALSTEKPSNTPASLVSDYPLLAQDFKIPVELSFADEHQHSSVLRISGHVNMWLHYDVMSNILCQIKGSKRIILFPPSDVSRLDFPPGETTSNIDVFRSERDRFEGCSSMETILSAGEVLFIPACWPHATAPATRANGLDQELSVAVNVFFKSLEDKFYAVGRDVYGNRDLEMYQNGRKHVGHIVRLLSGVDAKERSAKLAAHAQALKTQTWSIHEKYGGKEANRILTSARDLPTDLAQFYLHRLADELQYA
jgi:tRNA wybutosine-synthesizing protein 4